METIRQPRRIQSYQLRVSQAEKQELTDRAGAMGVAVSVYLRLALRLRDHVPTGPVAVEIALQPAEYRAISGEAKRARVPAESYVADIVRAHLRKVKELQP